jgi:hypothetical protein
MRRASRRWAHLRKRAVGLLYIGIVHNPDFGRGPRIFSWYKIANAVVDVPPSSRKATVPWIWWSRSSQRIRPQGLDTEGSRLASLAYTLPLRRDVGARRGSGKSYATEEERCSFRRTVVVGDFKFGQADAGDWSADVLSSFKTALSWRVMRVTRTMSRPRGESLISSTGAHCPSLRMDSTARSS